ncbi:MAG: mechanosensitive ion channel [Candidatus Latescibacteria bacterium]|nr:mechanosensitive ion channel [Candidatus Latescibacterota bacterium]
MNQIEKFEFPSYILGEVIITGILLAILLKIIRRIIVPEISYKGIKQSYPFLEMAVWAIYVFWAINILLKGSVYNILAFAVISVIIIFWLGWFVAGDFIAGIVLRLTEKYQTGQSFTFNDVSGTIIETNNLCLKLRQQDNMTVKIPYRKIIGAVQYKAQADDKTSQHRFDIQVPKQLSLEETQDLIRMTVLLSAGASIKKEPQIFLKKSMEQFWQFEVVIYAVSPEYYQLIERNVRTVEKSGNSDVSVTNPT